MDEKVREKVIQINNGEIPNGYKMVRKVGIIPSDWEVRKFKEIFKVNQGLQIPISQRFKTPIKNSYFYITNEFIKNRGNGGEEYYIQNPPNSVICNRDDILMTRTGNTGIVLTNVEGAFHNNFFKISFDRKLLNKDFVYYYLNSKYVQRLIRIYAGASTIPDLNHSDFYKIDFILMSFNEQQKIATILSTWDKAIKLKEKLIEQKKEQKKGLMQKLLTGEVRLPGFKSEWQSAKLGAIGKTYNGLSGKRAEDFGEGKPYIPYKTIFDDYKIDISKLDYVQIKVGENQNSAKYGDIFFTTSSETPDEVGMSSVLLDKVDVLYLNSFCFGYRLNDFNVLLPEFAQFLFRGNEFRSKIFSLAQGSTRFNISKNEVMKIEVLLPSKDEQKLIAAILSECDREIKLLQKQVEYLKMQKKGLMELLFNGIVRVQL